MNCHDDFPASPHEAPPGRSLWINSPIHSPESGWGNLALKLAEGLRSLGYFPYVTGCTPAVREKLPPWIRDQDFLLSDFDNCLHIAPPTYPPPSGPRVIFFTMAEVDRIPALAAHALDQCLQLIVPGWFSAQAVRKAGGYEMRTPVAKCPLGHDPAIFYHADYAANSPFTFGASGATSGAGHRKNHDAVVRAFLEAHLADTILKIKVPPGDPYQPCILDRRVILDRGRYNEQEMAAWYRSLSCYVSASHGEGWALQTHEAAACGRPTLVPRYGGTGDYWNDSMGWPINYTIEKAQGHYQGYHADWCVPDHQSMVQQMRNAYSNPSECDYRGQQAAQIMAQYTWLNTAKRVAEILADHDFVTRL